MQKYYPAEYYDGPPTSSHTRYLLRRFTREASYLKSLENGKPRRKLLDVGCANGDFPRFMPREAGGRGRWKSPSRPSESWTSLYIPRNFKTSR